MTIKEQLLQEIESSPDSLLQETLDFLKFLKTKQATEKDNIKALKSTGRSLFDYSKNMDSWEGNDLEECLNAVRKTRTQTKLVNLGFDDNDLWITAIAFHCDRGLKRENKGRT